MSTDVVAAALEGLRVEVTGKLRKAG